MTPRAFALMIRDAFGWKERVRTLVGKSEAEYATRDIPGLSAEERPILAYFLISGIYSREADAGRETALSRAEAAVALSRILGLSRDPFKRGVLRSIESGALASPLGDESADSPAGPESLSCPERGRDGLVRFLPRSRTG